LSAFYPNATYDFYGTPSGPLCVYKTGDLWPVRTGPESQRIIREACPVFNHPIEDIWLDIGERIYILLDDKKVHWTSIDPVAFAEAGQEPFCPLLLWIGVQPGSLLYGDAHTAAEAVTFLLANVGLHGIEVGFCESIVTRSVSSQKMLNFHSSDPFPELRKPFTPVLGLSISLQKASHLEGTGALYLCESKESDRIFLLTCAHVVQPNLMPSSKTGSPLNRNTHRENVIALGHKGYDDAVQSMLAKISREERSIKTCEFMLSKSKKYDKSKKNEYLALAEDAEKNINWVNNLHSKITKSWTHTRQRIIGRVAYVQPIGVQS
ncbi:hypothetical protein FB446DRAFT_600015, partial [Lentinula raphanica]